MHRRLNLVVFYAILALFLIFFLAPLAVMLATSLKADEFQILRDMVSLRAFWPGVPALDNYADLISGKVIATPFTRYLFNTGFIVGSIVALGLVVNSMAAFALSRLHFGARSHLVALVVALIIIPFESLAVPLFLMVNRLGWIDSYHVQIIPFIAHPFSIYLFYQFFNNIPKQLDEAARVDGASRWQIYWRIILPLSPPVIATVAILQSLEYWNSFLWPLMVTRGPEFRPLSVAMSNFFGQYPRHWGDVMAFAVLTSLPILVVYLLFQRWFIQSVARSGLKG